MPSLTDSRCSRKAEYTVGLCSIPPASLSTPSTSLRSCCPSQDCNFLDCCCRFRKRESQGLPGMISCCLALKMALPASSECRACRIAAP